MRPAFLHIPKCAGSSVKELLYENYGRERVFVDNSWEVRDELLYEPEKFNQYLAFAGHIPLSAFKSFFPSVGFFASVRHPFERHRSAYAFARREGTHPRHWHATNMTFEEWLLDEQEWNEQCFYLSCGELALLDRNSRLRTFGSVQWTLRMMPSVRIAPLPHLEFLLKQIARPYSWRTATLPVVNKTDASELPVMTEACRTLIETRDSEDLQLFEWLMQRPLTAL